MSIVHIQNCSRLKSGEVQLMSRPRSLGVLSFLEFAHLVSSEYRLSNLPIMRPYDLEEDHPIRFLADTYPVVSSFPLK